MTPWLLERGNVLTHYGGPPFLRSQSLLRFGELESSGIASLEERILDIRAKLAGSRHAEYAQEWNDRIAGELLFAMSVGQSVSETLIRHFKDAHPLGPKAPAFGDLTGTRFACALVPLDSGEGNPEAFFQLWVTCDWRSKDDSRDHRANLLSLGDHPAPFLPDAFSIYLVFNNDRNGPEVSGRSWELAARLATHALEENDDGQLIRALAQDWIITGIVKGASVGKVQVGNKTSIKTHRNWLFPIENSSELLGFAPQGEVKAASTLDDALDHLLNRGIAEGAYVGWPDRVEVLHSLVSKAMAPIIAIIAMTHPKRVVFWHSKDEDHGKKPTKELRDHLPKLFSEITFEEPLLIDSKSAALARQQLADGIRDDLRMHKEVYFNVTNGNFLMKFAVQNLALIEPRVIMIYKDLGNDDFTMLRYPGPRPLTNLFKPDSTRTGLDLEALKGCTNPNQSLEDIIKIIRPAAKPT